jgi:hypothetical protein
MTVNKRIVWTRADDGGVSITIPAIGSRMVGEISLKEGVATILTEERVIPDVIDAKGNIVKEQKIVHDPLRNVQFNPPVPLRNALARIGLQSTWTPEKMLLVDVVYTETESDFLARVQAKAVPADATNVYICDDTDIPERDEFRNALRQTSAAPPVVDMHEARILKTDTIRVERNKRLLEEDINYMKADEAGDNDEKVAIAAKKQKLRDLPATTQPDLEDISTAKALGLFEPLWPL